MKKMTCVVIEVTQANTSVKTHETVHLNGCVVLLCKLCLSKVDGKRTQCVCLFTSLVHYLSASLYIF